MIELSQLCKHFGDVEAVKGITFEVKAGEILGFLGPNGAGKSTTVKMLTGMLTPTSGRASVVGFDIRQHPTEVKKRIGYVPESGALFDSLTAYEYLELVSELHHVEPSLSGKRIEEFLALFGLTQEMNQPLAQFSKGMRQKVLLSAALIHNPEVLFLDEPLNGLDANAAMVIKELLRKMAAQGKTIMFCSHILEVVERICTRIAIIDKGQVVACGTPDEIMQSTGQQTLELAFGKLTGSLDAEVLSQEFLQALEMI